MGWAEESLKSKVHRPETRVQGPKSKALPWQTLSARATWLALPATRAVPSLVITNTGGLVAVKLPPHSIKRWLRTRWPRHDAPLARVKAPGDLRNTPTSGRLGHSIWQTIGAIQTMVQLIVIPTMNDTDPYLETFDRFEAQAKQPPWVFPRSEERRVRKECR